MQNERLVKSSQALVAILGSILKMSDDVKNALTPLDMQGKLLRMQNSIQKNGSRIAPHVKAVQDALELIQP